MGNHLHKPNDFYEVLTDDALKHCRTVTGFDNEKIRTEHAKFFDVANNGHLKRVHMEKIIGDLILPAKRKHARYLTDCIFLAMDTNDDGYIDFLEYLMSVKFLETNSPIEKAHFVFRVMDRNGDNQVTKNEIRRILQCLEEYHKETSNIDIQNTMTDDTKTISNAVIKKLDEDNSGFISASEFVDGWLKDKTIRTLFTL